MISNDVKEKNYHLYLKKLNQIGISTDKFDEILSDKLMNAPFGTKESTNGAYDGALIQTVLRVLTPYAIKLNELLPENIRVKNESIIKVCFLCHISKSVMFIPNDNTWERENRGVYYKYAETTVPLKMGMRSIALAQELGITLNLDELAAISNLDRDEGDEQVKFFSTPLCLVLKQALELTNLQLRLIKED